MLKVLLLCALPSVFSFAERPEGGLLGASGWEGEDAIQQLGFSGLNIDIAGIGEAAGQVVIDALEGMCDEEPMSCHCGPKANSYPCTKSGNNCGGTNPEDAKDLSKEVVIQMASLGNTECESNWCAKGNRWCPHDPGENIAGRWASSKKGGPFGRCLSSGRPAGCDPL